MRFVKLKKSYIKLANMDKKIVFSFLSGVLVTIFIAGLFQFSNRYKVTSIEDGIAYKVDSWTGDSWVLFPNMERKIKSDNELKNSTSETELKKTSLDSLKMAIEKVKSVKSYDYNYGRDNEAVIRNIVSETTGDFKVIGWKSAKIDSQIYLVWFELYRNGLKKTIGFEYNSSLEIVRRTQEDNVLEEKYKKYLE